MKGTPESPKRGYVQQSDGPSRPAGSPSTRRGVSQGDPLAGVPGRLSSGYLSDPQTSRGDVGNTRGRVIEGQNLRGYVDPGKANLPTPKDVTVSATGPKLIRNKRV